LVEKVAGVGGRRGDEAREEDEVVNEP
jgi:hypothetical protein